MTNIPDATENARLDDLTAYTSTLLGFAEGEDLDGIGAIICVRRRARSDADYRAAMLSYTHPDDLVAALVACGYSLASCGIESISR